MIYPVGFRRNSRYRGPMESNKLNCSSEELIVNLDVLRKTFDKQETSLNNIKHIIESHDMNEYKFRVRKMNDIVSIINGGVRYE